MIVMQARGCLYLNELYCFIVNPQSRFSRSRPPVYHPPTKFATLVFFTICCPLRTISLTKHTLTCGVCNDPVHTSINSIMIDTKNLRLIWNIILNNQSGAQQIDYFADFGLQDPLGNTYQGTSNLNTDFFLHVGQIVFKTEIFSFLPRPGVSYTLAARFGISGLTYDPLQFTF
jgi:hypothetical protein